MAVELTSIGVPEPRTSGHDADRAPPSESGVVLAGMDNQTNHTVTLAAAGIFLSYLVLGGVYYTNVVGWTWIDAVYVGPK